MLTLASMFSAWLLTGETHKSCLCLHLSWDDREKKRDSHVYEVINACSRLHCDHHNDQQVLRFHGDDKHTVD